MATKFHKPVRKAPACPTGGTNDSIRREHHSRYIFLFALTIFLAGLTACHSSTPSTQVVLPSQTALIPGTGASQTPGATPTMIVTRTPTQAPLPTQPLTQNVQAEIESQLAWFYKPPSNVDLSLIANKFGFFILTYGDESDWAPVRETQLKGPILEYLRFEAIQDPGSCTEQPWRNQVAYLPGDFCTISTEHPDWFMRDINGALIVGYSGDEKFVMMDPGNPGWQKFWLERAMQVQAQPGWDGVFMDNVEITLAFREIEGALPAAYPDDASYQAAALSFLKFVYENYFKPENKLLFANLAARRNDSAWNTFMQYLDGAMYEGWSVDKENRYRSAATWERQLKIAEDTQSQGKSIVLISQGLQDDYELQRFAYASYLLINNGRAAFRYGNSSRYQEAWLYPNYEIDLGQPLGKRYQVGSAWWRDFENGQVEVDPVQHTAYIFVPRYQVLLPFLANTVNDHK